MRGLGGRLTNISIRAAICELGVPFFFHEGAGAQVDGSGRDGQHVDAVDEGGGIAEVGWWW
jgi:hypothetical protein